MKWDKFDAEKVDHAFVKQILEIGYGRISECGVDISNKNTVKSHVDRELRKYKNNDNDELNKIIAVHIFRPEEFKESDEVSKSLDILGYFFIGIKECWQKGSKEFQRHINSKFELAGDKTLRGGRERVTLDSLVKVGMSSVAIEYETSTNIDNGYFTLKEALKKNRADFGVMVVPWSSSHSGRANEAIGIGRLDRDYNNVEKPIGPIFCISLVRLLDVYRELKKRGN